MNTICRKMALAGAVAMASLFVSAPAEASSIILNGSFENNTAIGTLFNMPNATFDATVANATAFGTAEEIDLVTSTDFGITPQDGNWKLGLHTQDPLYGGFQDAFSLSLSTGIVGGASYALSFYGALVQGDPAGTIQIGVSNSATSFGTLIFIASPFYTSQWDQFTNNFVAPSNASFLTVRTDPFQGYAFVDNFTLDPLSPAPVPEPATLTLLGVGLATIALKLRRRGRA